MSRHGSQDWEKGLPKSMKEHDLHTSDKACSISWGGAFAPATKWAVKIPLRHVRVLLGRLLASRLFDPAPVLNHSRHRRCGRLASRDQHMSQGVHELEHRGKAAFALFQRPGARPMCHA